VSADDGATWQTAGFGLTEPQVTIDRRLSKTRRRSECVVANDGFRSVTTEKTMAVKDL
jgi:hypothetical protein